MRALRTELRAWAPSATSTAAPARYKPVTLTIEGEAGFPATLTSTYRNLRLDRSEDDAAEQVQENSFIEFWREGLCLFRGFLLRITWTKSEGIAVASVTALDLLQILNDTQALFVTGGNAYDIWAQWSPSLDISSKTLKAGYDWDDGGPRHVWWPEPDDADDGSWVSTFSSNAAELGQNMTNVSPASGSELELTDDNGGLPLMGFVTIGTEWIEYNGLEYDQAASKWKLQNIRRAALGTTAAAHTSGDAVYGRVCKRIDPRGRIRIEGNNAGTWELIERVQCSPSLAAGSFAFADDPTTLAYNTTYSAIRATKYVIFDEEAHSNVPLLLSDLVSGILSVDPAYGGPGFGGAYTLNTTIDVGDLEDLILARARCDREEKALPFLKNLLSEVGLAGGPRNAVDIKYDSTSDSLVVYSVSQKAAAAADRRYRSPASLTEEVGEERVPTMVRAKWTEFSPFNLLSSNRMWHKTAAVDAATWHAGAPIVYHYEAGAWGAPYLLTWPSANAATIGTGGVNLLTDNDAQSGFALTYFALPAATHELFAWFPGSSPTAADLWQMDEIEVTLQLDYPGAGNSGGGAAITSVSIWYYDDLVGSTSGVAPTSVHGAKWMSTELAAEYKPGNPNQAILTLKASPKVLANAISLYVEGYTNDSVLNGYSLKVLDMQVKGSRVSYEYAYLSGTYSAGEKRRLVFASGAAKLIGAQVGTHVVDTIDVGSQSRTVAREYALRHLLSGLARPRTKSVTVRGAQLRAMGIAQLGETVTVARSSDEFAGVCHGYSYTFTGGYESLDLRLTDWRANVVGATGKFTVAALPAPKRASLRRAHDIRKAAVGRTRILSLDAA